MINPMKDSGVEWIGEIPKEWEIKKLRYLVKLRTGKGNIEDNDKYIGLENIESNTGRMLKSENVVDDIQNNIFFTGDVLLGKLRPYLRKVWRATFDGVSSSEFLVFYNSILNSDFLFWSILSDNFIENVDSSTYGTKMPRANWDYIKNISMVVPPVQEQQAIANFLDIETKKLDDAKDLLQQQIEKLKEYRKSLIWETVTKGLDKTAPMKDSGVDWIGEIPVWWNSERLKDFVKFQTGGTPRESIGVNQDRNGQKWFKPSDFEDDSVMLNDAENYITYEIIKYSKIVSYPKNTVLLVGIASIGKVGFSEDISYANQQITALLNNQKLAPKFLAYIMSGMSVYIKDTALYTVVPIVNNQYLSTLKIPVPLDLIEQQAIADFLDEKTSIIEKIISNIQSRIEVINKLRKTLIYDYVTGKRRVI